MSASPRYDEYFATVRRLLKDDGVMLLHAIGRSDKPGATNPWIEKYIFPGGYIPSVSEVMAAIERSGLYVTDMEILRLHYADTLKAWRERFLAHRDEAKAIYDERFCRMWEFYLAGSETSFRVDGHMVFQIQLAKRQDVVPRTRDYIAEREAQLRQREGAQSRLARRGALRRGPERAQAGERAQNSDSCRGAPASPSDRRRGTGRCAVRAASRDSRAAWRRSRTGVRSSRRRGRSPPCAGPIANRSPCRRASIASATARA